MLLHWASAEHEEKDNLPGLEKPEFLVPAELDSKAERMVASAFRQLSPRRSAQAAQAALWIAAGASKRAFARCARERAKGNSGDMGPDEMQILLDVFETNGISPVEFLSQESRLGASRMDLAMEQLENFGDEKAQILRARMERWELANPGKDMEQKLKMPAAGQMEEFMRLAALAGQDPEKALGKLMKDLEAQACARDQDQAGVKGGLAASPPKRI